MWPWRSAAETPAPYVELARSGEVERRVAEAHELLGESCVVCPRGCKVDRRAPRSRGLCAIGRYAVVASYSPHFGEENCLRGRRGSGTIFFEPRLMHRRSLLSFVVEDRLHLVDDSLKRFIASAEQLCTSRCSSRGWPCCASQCRAGTGSRSPRAVAKPSEPETTSCREG
jgi:hypothetical protein